ncbi:hypothetical protein [Gemmatimonas sp.]
MPIVAFNALPDSARLWVFAAAAPVTGAAAGVLLQRVDAFLDQWRAHGVPLVCARDWRDARFLAVAVDEAATDASGCSIDALFEALRELEAQLGTSLLNNGMVFWRDTDGAVMAANRAAFRAAATAGAVTFDTPVFDTTVIAAGAWRASFEKPVGESWHARLLPATADHR